MKKVTGLITANYSTKFPSVLEENRPVASLPFLGRYRLIDFTLSNMVNAGIHTVGIIMPYNYRSLIDHVGSGREWGLDRKKGGLFALPGSAFGTSRTGSRFLLRDLVANKAFLQRSSASHVVLSTSNFVYNMDLNDLYDAHLSSGADITVLSKTATSRDVDVISLELDGARVKGIKQGVSAGSPAFLDCFIVEREKLIEMLGWYASDDHLDLFEALVDDYDKVNVQAFDYDGYVAAVFNQDAYFKSSMELLDATLAGALFPEERTIRTKAHDNAPAKFEVGAKVTNSRISGGCRIFGTVDSSILGRGVVIETGAVVRNAVVMQNSIIKAGAVIENAIIDRNNLIPDNTELKGTPQALLVKEKGRA